MAARNTRRAGAPRNTRARSQRNTSQLTAFPSSENEKLRQGDTHAAVVSIRMRGAVIAKLDTLAREATAVAQARGNWNRITRSEIVKRAVAEYIGAAGKAGK